MLYSLNNTELIAKIVEEEWQMFSTVPNKGGQASCQEDYASFRIMRTSHFSPWSNVTLKSYFHDIAAAKSEGRNLMTEKYARMMEFTDPTGYLQIAGLLPSLTIEQEMLKSTICKQLIIWERDIREQFPFLNNSGRALTQEEVSQDSISSTSFEVYMQGELSICSEHTLGFYREDIDMLLENGKNASEIIYTSMFKMYGYKSLEEYKLS